MHRLLPLALVCSLFLVACGDDDEGGWSTELRDAYNYTCVVVLDTLKAAGIEIEQDSAELCTCSLPRMEARFTEADYVALTQEEKDAASSEEIVACIAETGG